VRSTAAQVCTTQLSEKERKGGKAWEQCPLSCDMHLDILRYPPPAGWGFKGLYCGSARARGILIVGCHCEPFPDGNLRARALRTKAIVIDTVFAVFDNIDTADVVSRVLLY